MIKEEIQNHGFVPDKITPDQHMLGGVSRIGGEVLVEDGQWDRWVPERELQNKNGLETYNCTSYGTLNCIETLIDYHGYEVAHDFSERYIGVMAGTTPNGNSPHKVIEIIRTEAGLISEHELPFSEEINEWLEYYSPNPMTANFIDIGRKFLGVFTIVHDWVFINGTIEQKQQKLIEALQYSPIGVSVLAWRMRNDGKYTKRVGEIDTHWVMCYGYIEGECWKIFDHYDGVHKLLAWDYDFNYAKRYAITEKKAEIHIYGIEDVIEWFRSLFAFLAAPFKLKFV